MEQIEVRILDRNFKLQVPAQERERLMRAVQIVDRKMRAIRDAGRAQGTDRIAVNAALQLVYEFLGREASAETSAGTSPTLADEADPSGALTPALTVADDAPAPRSTPSTAASATPAAAATAPSTASVAATTATPMTANPAPATPARAPAAVANKGHTATGHAAPARHAGNSRVDATRSDAPLAASRDAVKPGAAKRDVSRGELPETATTSGKPLADARIEEISDELEAEIRRQENLF